ncbi:hypothetical protein J2S00_003781 [Caldalkalibacillus uzonensis]|uniref:NHL repeat containing protein n=1 Tax=Caldalkalibacillus uzonensis TaxID=353224 RepID=A0ABU0CX04_9BACI|nr:NHL repeat-containing protein [Caldalkalibacillus uzonensis]MDQ0340941.1 hypothetical protein [Caldalkalibacillus uzonensis]
MGTVKLTAYPERWLGGPAPGGLTLPPAWPNRINLYAPRGVYMDDDVVVVADSGNHRLLIWYGWSENDHAPADVVLGQADFESEGPNMFHLPTGVAVIEGRLFVADAWHHRLLIWDTLPEKSNQPPDHVLGQPDMQHIDPNRGGKVCPTGFYWPYGFAYVNGWFYVADTGNRRILGWKGIPEDGQVPDLILGQPHGYVNGENRGKGVGVDTFRWPHALAGDERTLFVADAGNHRVLGYTPPPDMDRPADLVLGQKNFTESFELPHVPQGPRRLRFPYGISLSGGLLAVADTANNRVLLYTELPRKGAYHPASCVIGQQDFDGAGENRWQKVAWDTLCWPYGIWFHKNRLAIADSGNNRVIVWRLEFE